MQSPQFLLGLADELIADEFACGGGMSEGIEQAIGGTWTLPSTTMRTPAACTKPTTRRRSTTAKT